MADPKKVNATVTNVGQGPRSFTAGDGSTRILRVGETFEGEILQAELDSLGSDFSQDGAQSVQDAGPAGGFQRPPQKELTDDMGVDELIGIARDEGFATIAAQPGLGAEAIREAITIARETEASESQAEADALVKANTADQLRELAAAEKVELEGDDNKTDMAMKIVQARAVAANA